MALIERINAKGALLKVLDRAHLDLTTPIGRGFIAFLSAMAEDERQRIVGRANGGRQAARVRGVKFGRKPKLSAFQRDEVGRRLAAGEPIGDPAWRKPNGAVKGRKNAQVSSSAGGREEEEKTAPGRLLGEGRPCARWEPVDQR
jgi:DNA invertase Pin-like site-specific DNA recombinase